ncbi:MAG: hypothetical protein ABH896_00645 [Candidatus Jacksonbacteria bacterium]
MIVQLKPKFYKRWWFAFVLGMIAGPGLLLATLFLITYRQYLSPSYWMYNHPTSSAIPAYFEIREQDGDGNFVSTDLDSGYLISAEVGFDNGTGMPFLTIAFNDQGEQLLATITARNVGKQIGFFVNDEMVFSPTVAQAIIGGKVSLYGNLALKDAQNLAQSLKAGRGMTQKASDIVK